MRKRQGPKLDFYWVDKRIEFHSRIKEKPLEFDDIVWFVKGYLWKLYVNSTTRMLETKAKQVISSVMDNKTYKKRWEGEWRWHAG